MGPVVEISGQKCASFGKKANKRVKAGCVFTRVNNAAFKTCTNPPVAVNTAPTAAPTAAPAPVCASFSKAKKCRKNAACDWAKAAGKKYKTCQAVVTAAPTPAPAPDAIAWTNYDGCCRENWKSVQPYEVETFTEIDSDSAHLNCEESCSADDTCTAYEVI